MHQFRFAGLRELNLAKLNSVISACVLLLFCAATGITLRAQTFTSLASFDGTDGSGPVAGLVQATDGSFYGTTVYGGSDRNRTNPSGAIFKVTPSGTLTRIYASLGHHDVIISHPAGALVQGTNGDLYGTSYGFDGNVFKITLEGTLTDLQPMYRGIGTYPFAGLIEADDGNFYGTASEGGSDGGGTVFKITPDGILTPIYSFCIPSVCAGGFHPIAGLVQATNGDFYGTALHGGVNGYGTVYKVTPGGTGTTLYSFCSQSDCADGESPKAALIQGIDGNLYGTTYAGGVKGDGTVFKITPSGALTTLYAFCSQSNCTDGANPVAALVQGTDGNFYGTTYAGGANGDGTLFKMTPDGTLTTLYTFCSQSNCTDGSEPAASLIQGTDGDFYGTTDSGGLYGPGTVFRLSVDLGPFVETQTTSGRVGTVVNILGTDLSGVSSVMFNGTAAAFKVVSRSLITTTVPAGADTGEVQVVTPGGTLSSNQKFRVTP
jgi:uncharacterized repeat protein (TIGR03803 family)